jgi:antibiotic biosynthesis monooxygenase
VLVTLRFTVDADAEQFVAEASDALAALAACPGYQRGELTRAYDDPTQWCLIMEWSSVGAYRRALGSYDVKVRGTVVLGRARPEPSAFEVLASAEPGGPVTVHDSDRSEPGGSGSGRSGSGRSDGGEPGRRTAGAEPRRRTPGAEPRRAADPTQITSRP